MLTGHRAGAAVKRAAWASLAILMVTVIGTVGPSARPAQAAGVSSVSLVPASLLAGDITTYTVSYTSTLPLAAGGTITIDWDGNGVSSGNMQQLLPASATFIAGATGCTTAVSVVAGNSVVTLGDGATACSVPGANTIQFSLTNVRNRLAGVGSAGGLRTSADDATAVADPATLTWTGLNLTVTAQGAPGAGPIVTTAMPGQSVTVNAYPGSSNQLVIFTTTNGVFTANSDTTLACSDGSTWCDVDGFMNGVVSVLLRGPATQDAVTVTATAYINTATATVSFQPAVAAPPLPVQPVQQTAVQTSTGTFCFSYSGPTTQVAGFAALFAPTVTGVNVLNLPAGNYSSWFRAAPSLATATSISTGAIICVAVPVGSNVFA